MPSVLITGANRGLGLEFARRYVDAGWRVFAACRKPEAAAALEGLGRAPESSLSVHRLDVTDDAAIKRLALELEGQPIDVLINNAGINARAAAEPDAGSPRDWLDGFAVNSVAPVRIAAAFLPHVKRSDRRLIVTISSRMGSIAESAGGSYAYRASKAAVNAAMRCLSLDRRAEGCTVVVVHPGWVRTDMGGAAAPLEVGESVARLVALIERLGPEDNGRFLNYDGAPIPW